MRATNTTKPSSPVRYLLSADRRLQKLSLRKLSERLKKAKPQPRSTPSKPPVAAKPAVPSPPRAYSWRAIVVGVTCLLAAFALMTARQPSGAGEATGGAEPATAAMVPLARASVGDHVATKKTAVPKPVTAAPVTKPAPRTATEPPETAATRPVETAAAVTPANVTIAQAERVEPVSVPVTITGCLERDGEAFWLKDTSGADAPKSRSWRTGFLTRRSTRVELVDAGLTLKLSAHVGERVAATGTLADREMHARSVRRVAGACN